MELAIRIENAKGRLLLTKQTPHTRYGIAEDDPIGPSVFVQTSLTRSSDLMVLR